MNCEQVQSRLSACVDGELSAEGEAEVRSHLAGCPDCEREFRAFRALGECLAASAGASVARPDWGLLATRLDESLVSLPPALPSRSWHRFRYGAILAVAASVLAMVVVSWRSDTGPRPPSAVVATEAVIDWREFIDGRSSQPQVALNRLSEQFEGREASLREAEQVLGYSPAVSRAVAGGFRLISTRMLRLPECSCPNGGCQCASGACNSSASLCTRPDGSQWLLIEHCACQRISFGGLVIKSAGAGSRRYGIVEAEDRLAATWLSNNRRLIAIGLTDGHEVRSLVADTIEL